VTIFARRLSPLAAARSLSARGATLLGGLLAVLSAMLIFTAAPAGAVVSETSAPTVGLQPRNRVSVLDGNVASSAKFSNEHGNAVLHRSEPYVIYWDPTDHYHGDWQHVINGFVQAVGAASGALANVFAVDTQYTDKTNVPASYHSVFRGAYTDTHEYPTSNKCTDPHALKGVDAITCLTDAQIQIELTRFIKEQGLHTGMGPIFYLLTPPGVTVCAEQSAGRCSDYSRTGPEEANEEFASPSYVESFCSYHSDINPGNASTGEPDTILYAVIPWTAGGLGDYHLLSANRTPAFDCQDGGFNPASKPIEEHESAKEETKAENDKFKEANNEEKAALKAAREREGPHAQEPSQVALGPDGSYDTGLADLIINQIAVEQQNTVTDPLLNAWKDKQNNEVTDECRNFFASGMVGGNATANENTLASNLFNQTLNGRNYYLNTAFNLAALRLPYPAVPCLGGISLDPQFTSPSPVNTGEVVGFDGMESNISLNAAIGYSAGGTPQRNFATYTWNFGDSSPLVTGYAPGAPACLESPWLSPCAASVFHAYTYGGTYEVTLTVTDVGGNVASTTQPVSVVGPPPPSPGSTGGSTPTPPAAAGAGSGGASPPLPNPVAAAAVISRTLRSATKGGVVVRYSINEQVAGRFEVLLNSALARRLGISGSPAVGLPSGSAAQLVVAKAVIVTTTGGRSTVKLQFSKRTAQRLARQRRVAFMLRMIVRNAATHPPASTTVLSSFTLTH
jgi:hypothetical protein